MSEAGGRPQWITIGTITGPHGVCGEVRVYPHTDRPERFRSLTQVYLGASGEGGEVRLVRRAAVAPARIILKLDGVDTRDAAEALRGRDLLIPVDEVWPLPDGHFYHFQLVGLAVEDLSGKPRGRVFQVYSGPANDFYAIRTSPDAPEYLIPAVRQVVRQIDLERGRMVIDWPEDHAAPARAGRSNARAR